MLTVGRRRLVGGRSEAEAFRRWSSLKRAACRGWGARVEAEVVDVPPCRDWRWRRLELDLVKMRECVRSREARGFQRCREEGSRRSAGDGNLPLLFGLRRWRSPSAERERAGASKVSSRTWGEADGGEWRPTGAQGSAGGFYMVAWARSIMVSRRKRLGEASGGLGRRRAPSAVIKSSASVAAWFGRKRHGFSERVVRLGRDEGASVG
jgi:hypothetical protein